MDQPQPRGTLVIIGGHEDTEHDCVVLKEMLTHMPQGRLVIATLAAHERDGYFDRYRRVFARLGREDVSELYLDNRAGCVDTEKLSDLRSAAGVFFSGGDQLRITSQIGDTPFERKIQDILRLGGVIAGTSAGASAIGESMLIGGPSTETHRVGELRLAPGLGLLNGVIIDQHFAERGRIARLLGAVTLNPRLLGVGIEEDTAIVVRGHECQVVGSGAVYMIDGAGITRSNVTEGPGCTLSTFGVHLHVLSAGDTFDLVERRPAAAGHPLSPFAAAHALPPQPRPAA